MRAFLNPIVVKAQIDNLLAAYPALAEDEILRADMIEGATDAFDLLAKLVACIEETDVLLDGIAARLAEFKERVTRLENRKHGLRSLIFKLMEAADLKKAELPTATLSIRAGAPKVIITDEAALPDLLCRLKREPDKARIKEMLSDGHEVRGAALSNSEPSLSIRVK
jgi:hypothetical protein